MFLTPSRLSVKPNVMALMVPDYDFENQSRGTLMAGSHTSNSIQTFDIRGKPNDSKSDNND